ncbi:hypothetical protein [Legionella busanensis]|nr:hypothetical protein [Legionella busanensis]
MAKNLGISGPRVQALLCLLGNNLEGVMKLSEGRIDALKGNFKNKNLFDYLLNRDDFGLLSQQDLLKISPYVNKSLLAAVFSCAHDTLEGELKNKGLSIDNLQKRSINGNDYIQVHKFIIYVNNLRITNQLSNNTLNSQSSSFGSRGSIVSFQSTNVEGVDLIEDKLDFLLNHLLDINLDDIAALEFWIADLTKALIPITQANSTQAGIVREIFKAFTRSSHDPNPFIDKLLRDITSKLIAPAPILSALGEGYDQYVKTYKRPSGLPFPNSIFFMNSQTKNYSKGAPEDTPDSSSFEPPAQLMPDAFSEKERRPSKVRRFDSFFSPSTANNILSTLAKLALKFSAIKFTSPSADEEFETWLKDLGGLLQSFDIVEEKTKIEILAAALPYNFDNPEFRTSLLLANTKTTDENFYLLIEAMFFKYPSFNKTPPR